MTDASQTIVWRWDRDAFGLASPDDDPDGAPPVDRLDLRFPGQILDEMSGLYGGLNTYAYVQGNPVSSIDPLGLESISIRPGPMYMSFPIGGGGGAIVGGAVIAAGAAAVSQEQCPPEKKSCPPCDPPVGTTRYRKDIVPPSKPHWPYSGTHYHLFQMNQDPKSCRCFWNKAGVTDTPPPDASPM